LGVQLTPPPSQTPASNDQADSVLQGTITAVGATGGFSVFGPFNFTLWGTVATALTTTNGTTSASVSSGTGISAGMTVISPAGNVPLGTTWATFSGTSGTLAFPPGFTSANVVSGTDSGATFATVAVTATVQLERTHDGGATWIPAGIGGAGQQAIYTNPGGFTAQIVEVERGISYRVNCTAYSSGVLHYRLSGTAIGKTTFGPWG